METLRLTRDALLLVLVLLLVLMLGGCGVPHFLGSTTASYEAPNGVKVYYSSNKNQENFKARLGLDPSGRPNVLDIETTATTPEAAIAATLQVHTEVLRQLMPLIQKAVSAGATIP